MSDDVKNYLMASATKAAAWAVAGEAADAILRDPSLLIVARPVCVRCNGTGYVEPMGGRVTPSLCPDCDGTGYTPMVALPQRVIDELVRCAFGVVRTAHPDFIGDAIVDGWWKALIAAIAAYNRLAEEAGQ